MSRIFELYLADERDARGICEDPECDTKEIWVAGFDEARQLSLLSLFMEIPPSPKYLSFEFYRLYHQYFRLLYPSEFGAETFVSAFPTDLVQALTGLTADAISELAATWMNKVPKLEKLEWTLVQFEDLLSTVCRTCEMASDQQKLVLFRCCL
ncbi:MAG TPA: hypothetical protein V6C81_05240 [Planktothrix sp.]|jgi:hypothetical protein